MEETARAKDWPDGRPLPENMRAGAREMADLIENGQTFTFEQRLRQDYNSMWLEDFRDFLGMINENLTKDEKHMDKTLPKLDVLDSRYNFHLPLQLVPAGRYVGKSVLDAYSRSQALSSAYDTFKDDYFNMNSCLESTMVSGSSQGSESQCTQKISSYEKKRAKLPVELHLD